MVTKLLVYSLLLTVFHPLPAQENDAGIFLTAEFHKNCKNLRRTRDKKIKVCTPLKPIILPDEFSGITEIQNDNGTNLSYFYLILSQPGYDKLKNIIDQLSETELVLVVDNTVVGFVKNKNQIVNKSLRIDGPLRSDDVKWVYERLQRVIQLQTQK
jgi:hypothetical protein